MRLLLGLRAMKSFSYDSNYYNKIQGLVYNHIKNTAYNTLHDKAGTKFFCFSNIFPGGRNSKTSFVALDSLHRLNPEKTGLSTDFLS